MEGQFEKYVNLIRKRAHFYSKKYKIDYQELESQGFEIYVYALNNFDISKSTFSTHLYIELNRLDDYCQSYKRIANDIQFAIDTEGRNQEDNIQSKAETIEMNQLLEDAKNKLSDKGYKLFNWILSWEWDKKYITKPTINIACKHFEKPRRQMEKIWNECKNYWNNQGYLLYY